MLTTTGYLRNFRVFGILAVLAAILTVLCRPAVTNAMRALLIVCHRYYPSNRVHYIRPYRLPKLLRFTWRRWRSWRRARKQVRRDDSPLGRFATNAYARTISLKRFIHRNCIGFENSFATADTSRVVESHDTRNERVRNAARVLDDQTNVCNWRLGRAVERGSSQRTLERSNTVVVVGHRKFVQRHALFVSIAGRLLRAYRCASGQNHEGDSEFDREFHLISLTVIRGLLRT